MQIFIQGRKNGYNSLYPKPTPKEFKYASDIQRIDAQNNAQCYGKSLYSIGFNGSGSIFTKYIIGYDTLRGYIGNIGISIFIPSNQKMLGADIKSLLDELINIYTTNYCPDFKINNQKQEDWLLFSSAANNYDSKVKTILADENFQYGNKDAAYIYYNNTTEIEKYLEAPYQEEFKERKQVFFIDNQSQLLLEVIKHDQTANLTGKIDLENPSYKLRDYHGQGKNGISIEIRSNNKLRNDKDKIFRKDNVTIKYSKKYYKDIFAEGKLSEPQIEQYLKISDNSIDIEKNIELNPTEIPVEIRIYNSKGEPINDAVFTCKSNYSKSEKKVYQNTINFSGEEQKDRWTISAKKDLFTGEETFTPEHNSIVKLTLRDIKIFKLQAVYGANHPVMSKTLTFEDDKIRKKYTEYINIKGYKPQNITFIPENQIGDVVVVLQKQVIQQPISQGPKVGPTGYGGDITKPQMPFKIKILLGSSIACLLVLGVYFSNDMLRGYFNKTTKETKPTVIPSTDGVIKLDTTEIRRYVEGDVLFLDTLNKYRKIWEKQNKDNANYKKYDEFIDKAIKKREAITNGNFVFFIASNTDVKYSIKQQVFKIAVRGIDKSRYAEVITKLGDVSKLTLTQIADSINKILGQINDQNATNVSTNTSSNNETIKKKEEEKAAAAKKAKEERDAGAKAKADADANANKDETDIRNYLKGKELKGEKLKEFKNNSNISEKLKKSISLALEFWSLDGNVQSKKTYSDYMSKVQNDEYLKNNSTLTSFLINKPGNIYPKNTSGAGTTLTLSKFIE